MTSYPPIWLLRHGQTKWNAERRIQGQLESPLTPLGIEHAQAQAGIMTKILANAPSCFASPLGRAQETAQIALAGRAFTTDPRLAEVHAGDWQGLLRDDVQSGWPDIFNAAATPLDLYCSAPNGERFEQLAARISDFLSELTNPSVIVAHGLLGQVLRGLLTGLDRAQMGAQPNDQGCVYLLENAHEQVLR